jgi:hypothetical protein
MYQSRAVFPDLQEVADANVVHLHVHARAVEHPVDLAEQCVVVVVAYWKQVLHSFHNKWVVVIHLNQQ